VSRGTGNPGHAIRTVGQRNLLVPRRGRGRSPVSVRKLAPRGGNRKRMRRPFVPCGTWPGMNLASCASEGPDGDRGVGLAGGSTLGGAAGVSRTTRSRVGVARVIATGTGAAGATTPSASRRASANVGSGGTRQRPDGRLRYWRRQWARTGKRRRAAPLTVPRGAGSSSGKKRGGSRGERSGGTKPALRALSLHGRRRGGR